MSEQCRGQSQALEDEVSLWEDECSKAMVQPVVLYLIVHNAVFVPSSFVQCLSCLFEDFYFL